ncbi:MAG: hypothetical protein WCW16_01120 [Candidatus Magasanikbacteria bacterium]
MNVIIFVISTGLGFLITKLLSAKKEGQPGRIKSVRIRIGPHILHIHHWLYGGLLLLLLWFIGFYNNIVYGFLAGVVVQGLTYKDFYLIYYNEEQYRKKYPLEK